VPAPPAADQQIALFVTDQGITLRQAPVGDGRFPDEPVIGVRSSDPSFRPYGPIPRKVILDPSADSLAIERRCVSIGPSLRLLMASG